MIQDCRMLDREQSRLDEALRKDLRAILQGRDASGLVEAAKDDVLSEQADIPTLQRLMNLVLLKVHHDEIMSAHPSQIQGSDLDDATPVHRAC